MIDICSLHSIHKCFRIIYYLLQLTSPILLRARCLVPQLYYFFDATTIWSRYMIKYRVK